MLKKILLASSVLALTSTMAFAAAPYAGVGLGLTTNTANHGDGHFRGVPFNVVAGFGGVVDQNMYLAGEFTGTVATGKITEHQGQSLRSTYGYTASIVPGLMLSDHTMAFAKAGLGRTHFESVSGMRTHAQYGLGMQTSITQNVDLRGEYDFVAARAINQVKPRLDQASLNLIYKFE